MQALLSIASKAETLTTKLSSQQYEDALIIVEELIGLLDCESRKTFENLRKNIMSKNIEKIINEKNYDEALTKIQNYQRENIYSTKELNIIESKIYFYKSIQNLEQKNIDDAIRNVEIAIEKNPEEENFKMLNIKLLMEKKSYDEILIKINEIENNISNENIKTLKKFKSVALNNKAVEILSNNNLEESLVLLNESVELDPENDTIKSNRFVYFKKLYVELIEKSK